MGYYRLPYGRRRGGQGRRRIITGMPTISGDSAPSVAPNYVLVTSHVLYKSWSHFVLGYYSGTQSGL